MNSEYFKRGGYNQLTYSTFQIQHFDENTCGEYCLYVLDRLNKGDNFYKIMLDLINQTTF